MKELRLTGIMYPPPERFDEANPRTLLHQCEEFVSSELDGLIEQMVGLPLLVEHCDTELVGSVECAKKTAEGAIEIEAVIKSSCDRSRLAIKDILDKKLVGLSLSHEYRLTSPADSHTSNAIRLNLVEGKGWKTLTNTSGHTIQKKLRELSLTTNPARPECFFSSTVCASAQKQNLSAINIDADAGKQPAADTRIVGVFSCSGNVMATDQEINASDMPSGQEADKRDGEAVPQDAAVAGQPLPDAAAEPVAEPPASEAPVAEPVAEAVVEPVVQLVAEPIDDEADRAKGMQTVMDKALQRMEAMKARMDESDKQRETDIKKRTEEIKVEQALKLQHESEIKELRTALHQKKEKELQTAKKQRDDTFNRLTETLSTLECDLEKRKPKTADAKGQLQFESDVAEAAIKRIVAVSDKANVMHSENNQLKRQHRNIEETLCNFEGGRVEASAAAAAKRQHVQTPDADSFLAWKRKNPTALKWQVDAQLKKFEDAKRGTVRVNASFLKWNEAPEAQDAGPMRPPTSSIYTSYPEIASELMMLNTGKLISGEETMHMMRTTPDHTQVTRNQPWR